MKQSEERWLISRWRWGSGARSIGEWVRLLEEAGDRIYRHPWLDVFANRFLRTFTVEPRAAVDQLVLQRAKKLAVTALMPRAVGAALFWPRTRSFGLAWASAERAPPPPESRGISGLAPVRPESRFIAVDRYSQPAPDPERFNDFGPRLFTLDSASRRGNIICFFEPPEGGLGG